MGVHINIPYDRLIKFCLPFDYHIVFDNIPSLNRCGVLAKDMYGLFIQRMQISMSLGTSGYKGVRFYNKERHYFYIVFKMTDLEHFYGKSEPTISKALKKLERKGFVYLHRMHRQHYTQIALPNLMHFLRKHIEYVQRQIDYLVYQTRHHKKTQKIAQKLEHRESHDRANKKSGQKNFDGVVKKSLSLTKELKSKRTKKTTSDTVNTENAAESKSKSFVKIDPLEGWVDSVHSKQGGLTLGASQCIARFCSKHYKHDPVKHCRKIYKILVEARGSVLKGCHKHLPKKLVRFESNDVVINGLEGKLRKVFTRAINENSKKLNVHHFYSYLMTSLENFFYYDAFRLGKKTVVTPQSRVKHIGSRNGRKPIKESIPQWMKDERAGKVKPKKTDELLAKLDQARNAHLQVIDDPTVSQDEKDLLQKRERHYEKLYDAQQKAAKPTPKPKQHKQCKQVKEPRKTSKALHNRVQAELKEIGEI